MPFWQIALIALVIAWALQAAGTFWQMSHYRSVMSEISRRWADGFVGAGSAKSTFGRGVILLLVVGPDGIIRRLSVMQGRSIFAKFKPCPEFEGRPFGDLRAQAPFDDPGRSKALAMAIEQIDKRAVPVAAKPLTEVAA